MNTGISLEKVFRDLENPHRSNGSGRVLKRKLKRRSLAKIDASPEEDAVPAIGTMARTKRLILAALRVWELKRGIRD